MGTTTNTIALDDVFRLTCPSDRHVGYWLQRRRSVDVDIFTRYLRGELRPRKPVEFKIEAGSRFTDVLGNGLQALIVSERCVKLFRKSGFTGWRAYPAVVYDKNDCPIKERVYGIAIIGRAGPHDTSRGITRWFKEDDGSKSVQGMKGLYFKPKNWDGSDCFMLDDANYKLVTSRVIAAMNEATITGFIADPIKEVRF